MGNEKKENESEVLFHAMEDMGCMQRWRRESRIQNHCIVNVLHYEPTGDLIGSRSGTVDGGGVGGRVEEETEERERSEEMMVKEIKLGEIFERERVRGIKREIKGKRNEWNTATPYWVVVGGQSRKGSFEG
ncbi:unnamed protein product [Lupinus luteus]|uniref:Uncharacterized protein n=1 Tax=Lupinus luteus TaxID=3873 RepID=A0AAV1XZ02_LUPLU